MYEYRVEVTKNGATKNFIERSEKDPNTFREELWKTFTGGLFAGPYLMARDPDFIQITMMTKDSED